MIILKILSDEIEIALQNLTRTVMTWRKIQNINIYFLSYLPTPPLRQDMAQGQLFKQSLTGLNSEFSFS